MGNHKFPGSTMFKVISLFWEEETWAFCVSKRSCPNKWTRVQFTSREMWYPTVSPNSGVIGFVLSSYQDLCFLLTDNHFCFSQGKGKLPGFPLVFLSRSLSRDLLPPLGEHLLCFPTIPLERAKSFIVVRNNFISLKREKGGGLFAWEPV